MVNREIIIKRIEQIERHLEKISAYRKLSRGEFLKDSNAQDIVEYNLFQIVNHLIDIMQHIVVDEDYGLPQTAYEAVEILQEKGFLNKKDLDLLKKMIGFRNVVGHDYISIDKVVVHRILTGGERDIKRVIGKITKNFL